MGILDLNCVRMRVAGVSEQEKTCVQQATVTQHFQRERSKLYRSHISELVAVTCVDCRCLEIGVSGEDWATNAG